MQRVWHWCSVLCTGAGAADRVGVAWLSEHALHQFAWPGVVGAALVTARPPPCHFVDDWKTPKARQGQTCNCSASRAQPLPPLLGRNCEIYNHKALIKEKMPGMKIPSGSDAAVIGYMVQELGESNELWNSLDGIFACCIWDEATEEFVIARDPLGICSLYWGRDENDAVWVASEMKALQHLKTLDIFPPVRPDAWSGVGGGGPAWLGGAAREGACEGDSRAAHPCVHCWEACARTWACACGHSGVGFPDRRERAVCGVTIGPPSMPVVNSWRPRRQAGRQSPRCQAGRRPRSAPEAHARIQHAMGQQPPQSPFPPQFLARRAMCIGARPASWSGTSSRPGWTSLACPTHPWTWTSCARPLSTPWSSA